MTSVLIDEPSRASEFYGDHDLSFSDIDGSCLYSAQCGHQLAAKTGTTDSFADNWTIGYTPDVTVAVWAGNSNDTPMDNVVGITGAAPIFHSVIERALGYCNVTDATVPGYSYNDGIPCGPDYSFRFSKNPTWTFPIPDGVVQSKPIDPSAGSAEYDWMLQQ
jgi:membrane carboxypeptidase/penicillin-binding protein PbpC